MVSLLPVTVARISLSLESVEVDPHSRCLWLLLAFLGGRVHNNPYYPIGHWLAALRRLVVSTNLSASWPAGIVL